MLRKIPISVGIFRDEPPLSVETYFQDGNNVRSYRGKVEKLGGWQKLLAQPMEGKARNLTSWASNTGGVFMAAGTHSRLYAIAEDALHNITPWRQTGTLTGPFATTNGSKEITVTDASHGLATGDAVNYSGATAGGGVTVDGEYRVLSIIDGSTYTIQHGTAATSTASSTGGTVSFSYEIPVGQEYGALFFGWGVGSWGGGTWGTPRTSNILLAPRTWSLDHWGEYLLASPRGGTLYEWDLSLDGRAVAVANAPARINYFFITPERFVVALGANEEFSGLYNPMLVRWCSQSDNTDWTASATDTAGEFQLAVGSRIVAGCSSRLQNLIWSDTALFSMQYRADIEFVFGFDVIGTNCGLAGPNAYAEKDGMAFWMTPNGQFYVYDGAAPRALDCPNQRYVYENIVRQQFDAIHCGINSKYSEVWWWYSDGAGNTNENNRFISYNYADNAWFIGDMARTAWQDKTFFEGPVGVGPDSYIYIHEVGTTADGAVMNDRIETAPFDMDDGDMVVNLSRIVPDMDLTGAVDFTIRTRRFPAKPMEMELVREYNEAMHRIDLRAQGRQMSISISSRSAETSWRMGDLRVDVTPAGPR